MAASWFLLALPLMMAAAPMASCIGIGITFSSPEQKLHGRHHPQPPTSTISAAPALLPHPAQSPVPVTALSPDISPLLPSPGGERRPSPSSRSSSSSSSSSVPTIPSNPSPPNPDEIPGFGNFSAVPPSGSKLTSTASTLGLFGYLNSAVLLGFLVLYWKEMSEGERLCNGTDTAFLRCKCVC